MQNYQSHSLFGDGRCGFRALHAALRYAGSDARFHIPDNVENTRVLITFARQLGLTVYACSAAEEALDLTVANTPVLVVYKVPAEPSDTDTVYHAVFTSDIGPLTRYDIHVLIMGWEHLTPEVTKETAEFLPVARHMPVQQRVLNWLYKPWKG